MEKALHIHEQKYCFSVNTYQYERYIIVFHIHMRGERVLTIKLVHCLYIYWKWESYFQHCYRFIIIKTELGLKNVWHFKKYINFLFLYFYSFFFIVWKHVYVFFSKPVVKRIHLEQLDNEWNSPSIAPVLQKLRSLSCIGIDKYLPFSMARLCDLISNY